MIHYFGQPQNIFQFKDFCSKHSLVLIEDNAHGYGGKFELKLLGTYGDIGISSPRKIFNTSTGGLLYVKGKEANGFSINQVNTYWIKQMVLRFFRKNISLKVAILKILKRLPNFSDPSAYKEPRVNGIHLADNFSRSVIVKEIKRINEIAALRRERWKKWDSEIIKKGLIPIFPSLYDESCPWAYPFYVSSLEMRNEIVNELTGLGIFVFSWPSLPTEFLDNTDNSAVNKWFRLICISLDQEPYMRN